MAKRSKKLLKTKTLRKAFKKHPYGAAAALVALGSIATVLGGGSEPLRRLKDGAMRRLLAARNALHNEETVAQRH